MVTPGFHPVKGGTETVVRNLSMELNRIGVDTDVMTFNMDRKWNPKWSGKTERIDRTTVFRVPALNWLPIEHSSAWNQECVSLRDCRAKMAHIKLLSSSLLVDLKHLAD